MQIRIRETGAIVQEYGFRLLHSNTSFPALTEEVLDAFGADFVLQGSVPTATRYQAVIQDGVEQIDDKWYTKYGVTNMDVDAIAAKDDRQANSIRTQRNDKLRDSDWTQVTDAPVDKTAWATYRQALRDVTGQEGFPWTITWPEQP